MPAYNFAAGPATLPEAVLARANAACFARGADGAGLLERPFGHPETRALLAHARQRLASLLALPDDWHVLFLAGGATQQFSVLPLNLRRPGETAVYADSGYWARRAFDEARRGGAARLLARADGAFLPPLPLHLPDDSAYCHLTLNETADGVAWPALPERGAVPLVADATSCFLAAPLAVEWIDLVYASAQKNIGVAGMTVLLVRDALLRRAAEQLPPVWSFRAQAGQDSCVNTPPLFAIQIAALVFDWIAEQGGVAALAAGNRRKARALYAAIDGCDGCDGSDGSDGFYRAPVPVACRSSTNVRFHLADEALTGDFLAEADAAGLRHLRGHPQFGGLRASLYNAMPEAGVAALTDFMADYRRRRG